MKDVVFKEYDIRGRVGTDLLFDQVYAVGKAIVVYFKTQNPTISSIAIGMDGRIHSPVIKKELTRAFIDCGITVIFLGVCTSPMVYFASHTQDIDASIVITASHNPKDDNGIKLMLGKRSLWGDDIRAIKDLYHAHATVTTTYTGKEVAYDIKKKYLAYLQNEFAHLKKSNISFLIDCSNGAAGIIVPDLITQMQWDNVKLLYADVDGTFPNHEADPTKKENMSVASNLVKQKKYVFGIGFDGDADRCAVIKGDGELLLGDRLLAILAKPIVKKTANREVVCNVVCSNGLSKLVSTWGGKVKMVPVGRSYIEDYMQKSGALIGGETSGHLLFADRYFGFDDGIYAMMRLIEILCAEEKSIDTLASEFPHTYTSDEFRIFCPEQLKKEIIMHSIQFFQTYNAKKLLTIDGVRATVDDGWILIRKSNTQEVISVRCESNTKEGLQRLQLIVHDLLRNYLNETDLKVLK